jgi:WD40 repeat protein
VNPDGQAVGGGCGEGGRRPQGPHRHVRAVAFSPDGKTLVTAGDDQAIHFWDVSERK